MKLKIKQTGEVVDAYSIDAQDVETIKVQYFTKNGKLDHFKFNSLEELNNCLEDYKPTPPYLKDEKIRKFVRDWAKYNKIVCASIKKIIADKRGFEPSWFKITGQDNNSCVWSIEIHADYLETVCDGYDGEIASIEEICGSEDNENQGR